MSWTHDYHPAARWGLLNKLPLHAAERLDAAIIEFARSGRGSVTRIEPDDPNAYRLRVEGAVADLFIDARARTILVTRVYRRR